VPVLKYADRPYGLLHRTSVTLAFVPIQGHLLRLQKPRTNTQTCVPTSPACGSHLQQKLVHFRSRGAPGKVHSSPSSMALCVGQVQQLQASRPRMSLA